jgi:hypothetical protein
MNKNGNRKIDSIKNKISIFENENNNLIHRIEDYKKNLELNFEILKKTFIKFGCDEKKVNNNIIKIKSLINKYDILLEKKKELKKDIYSLKQNLENKKNKIFNEMDDYTKENEKLSEEINRKDIDIKKLKDDLMNIRGKAFFKNATREIKVCPPTKNNVLINQEIINEKNIILKVINISKKKEGTIKNIKSKYNSLYNRLKKESEEKHVKINNIDQLKIEEENNEIESSSSSSSSEDEESTKNKKDKLIVDKLKEQRVYLKKKYKEYRNKIDSYKQEYKIYKKKILDIKKLSLNK